MEYFCYPKNPLFIPPHFSPLATTDLFTVSISSVQFSSVAQSCLTLWDSMDCSTPGLPVHQHLPEFAQAHVHRVGDAIQPPSHPPLFPSPPAFSLSQHQGLFQWVSSFHQVAEVLELQLQHSSFQWIFKTDFLYNWLVWSLVVQGTLKSLLQHQDSNYNKLLLHLCVPVHRSNFGTL